MTLRGANHDSFVLRDRYSESALEVTIAFLRGFLLNDAAARAWFEEEGNADVSGTTVSVERKPQTAR